MTAKPCPVCRKPPDNNEKLGWFWCCNPECQMQDGSFKIDTWNRLYLAPEDCPDPMARIKELEQRCYKAEKEGGWNVNPDVYVEKQLLEKAQLDIEQLKIQLADKQEDKIIKITKHDDPIQKEIEEDAR